MSRDRTQAVFVRDSLTAQQLQRLGIKACCAGNPMMDGLAPTGRLTECLEALRTSEPVSQEGDLFPEDLFPENRCSQSNSSLCNQKTAAYITSYDCAVTRIAPAGSL